jgi:gamma-glutamylcyclotransferase (GGCT)/AIG2-like uncharacterized protein YtfP
MTQNPDYLFVYGTLQPSFVNPFAHFLRQNSQFAGVATIPGLLFDLGSYPGAIYLPNAATLVQGTLYNISARKSAVLNYLDEYEGIGYDYALPHEYIRTVIPARLPSSQIDCWAYLFNLTTDDKQLIPSGDYAAYSRKE